MLIYRQACINVNIDMTSLEREGYDINESDPKLYDDSTLLDLAELKQDTLFLHSLDEETDEIDTFLAGKDNQTLIDALMIDLALTN